MGKIIQIKVDESLATILDNLRKTVATDFKKKYGLEEIIVPRTLSSRILAAKLSGQKTMTFKINKSSLNKGSLEIL